MIYDYHELPTHIDEEALMAVGVIILAVVAVIALFALAFWILSAMSLHSIARRRGIRNAWLAWVPIGKEWILGSVSDQYQHLVQGKITSRRKTLTMLALAGAVLGVAGNVIPLVRNFAVEMSGVSVTWEMGTVIPAVLSWIASVAVLVVFHICNYDLYRSCDPKNAVAFLVLGILFPIAEPFFYLACRKKDWGMVVPEYGAYTEPADLPRANPEF